MVPIRRVAVTGLSAVPATAIRDLAIENLAVAVVTASTTSRPGPEQGRADVFEGGGLRMTVARTV